MTISQAGFWSTQIIAFAVTFLNVESAAEEAKALSAADCKQRAKYFALWIIIYFNNDLFLCP